MRLNETLCIIPIAKAKDGGTYAVAPTGQIAIHYMILASGGITCLYKLWACAYLVQLGEINMRLFICMGLLMNSFSAWFPLISLTRVSEETAVVMNSWSSVRRLPGSEVWRSKEEDAIW